MRRWLTTGVFFAGLLVGFLLYSYLALWLQGPVTGPRSIFPGDTQMSSGDHNPLHTSNMAAVGLKHGRADALLIPSDDILNDLTTLELEDLWMRYVENIQQACGIQYHVGDEMDGGYHVCEKYLTKGACLVYSFGSHRMYQFEDDLSTTYRCEIHTFDPLYVENIQQACGIQYHVGDEMDGGYHVCEKYLTKGACLVYSFGSHRMYQFEDDLSTTYRCEIHTFDPFDGQIDHRHSPSCTFHSLGLSNEDNGKLLTLTSIKERLGHSGKTLDILKIDIEGGEWASIPNIIESGEMEHVKLFIVELHVCLNKCTDGVFRSRQHYLSRLYFLRTLYGMGFRIYYFRQWPICKLVVQNRKVKTGCHEVHFMRVD